MQSRYLHFNVFSSGLFLNAYFLFLHNDIHSLYAIFILFFFSSSDYYTTSIFLYYTDFVNIAFYDSVMFHARIMAGII